MAMDKPQIDKDGNGILFYGNAKINFIKDIEDQKDVFLIEVQVELERKTQIAPQPGQFYMIKGTHSNITFGRPISVYHSEKNGKTLKIQFMILQKGEGTKEIHSLLPNDTLSINGPLGNTFSEYNKLTNGNIAIIGGGIGVAPVANFASTLTNGSYDFYASFRSGSYGLENIHPKELIITTNDGSVGIKGMLNSAFTKETIKSKNYKTVFACGPTPMLSYIQSICKEEGIKCYLSLEKKMLCGVGACLGCTISTKDGNRRVCKDGPIFDGDILEFPDQPQLQKQSVNTNIKPSLCVKIAGIEFKNPVIAASGTFGFAQNYRGFFDVEKLGGVSSKGLTLEAKSGNNGERIIEITGGDINSIGLENPGVPHFIENELKEMLLLDTITIANLAGHSLESYVKGAELLDKTDVHMIELNISCPNVKAGGMAWGINPINAAECVSAVRKATKKPLIVKLSPNAPDLIAVALACIDSGADALSLINTIQAVAIDIEKGRPYFENVKAGMCGPAIKPIALRMVYDVCSAINKLPESKQIPVIGLGGISKWQDAVEFIMAGASAIQVGSATFANPNTMIEIIDGLETFMKNHGYKTINDFKGIAL